VTCYTTLVVYQSETAQSEKRFHMQTKKTAGAIASQSFLCYLFIASFSCSNCCLLQQSLGRFIVIYVRLAREIFTQEGSTMWRVGSSTKGVRVCDHGVCFFVVHDPARLRSGHVGLRGDHLVRRTDLDKYAMPCGFHESDGSAYLWPDIHWR